MSSDVLSELTILFEKAGPAHHQAYIETDGEDADWPLWYAEYLYDSVRDLTHFSFTKSELVWLLVEADRKHRTEASSQPWYQFYAELFRSQFGK